MILLRILSAASFAFSVILLIYAIRVNEKEGNYGWVLIYVFMLLIMIAVGIKVF